MHLSFLCPNHRRWLSTHLQAATTNLTVTQDTAMYYSERGLFAEATPYLGCAFETAEILLSQHTDNRVSTIRAFTTCSIKLADSFLRMGRVKTSLEIYQLAIDRLQLERIRHQANSQVDECLKGCVEALAYEQTEKGVEMPPGSFSHIH